MLTDKRDFRVYDVTLHSHLNSLSVWGIVAVKEDHIEAPIGRYPRDRKRIAVVQRGHPATQAPALRIHQHTGGAVRDRAYPPDSVPFTTLPIPHFRRSGVWGSLQTLEINIDLHRRTDALLKLIDRQALDAAALQFDHPVSRE
ncbi:MAG: hypothetical protein JW384_01942 [Nitrosomonadaceae bacterium]|nr:hypothetical protein [Nitrosomonadaceae bacterium]